MDAAVRALALTWMLALALAPGQAETPGSQAWRDPSPHQVFFVSARANARLEVLEWGEDRGASILLLPGHGDTGHVYDDFAPRLAQAGFRVLALTRRGLGASSQPESGYDLTTLTTDIESVLEARHAGRVHLVGHSIAGDEMTRLALASAEKLRSLVYLDAAYDRVAAREVEATFPALPPLPAPGSTQLSSPERVREYVERVTIRMPESEIRATRIFAPDGRFVGPVTPDRILRALASAVEHPQFSRLRHPVLAIYAIPLTPGELVPRYRQPYESGDAQVRRPLDAIFDTWQRSADTQRKEFRRAVPHATVVELRGASHYVFISHANDVLREVVRFLRQH